MSRILNYMKCREKFLLKARKLLICDIFERISQLAIPVGNYMFEVNNRNTRIRCKIKYAQS